MKIIVEDNEIELIWITDSLVRFSANYIPISVKYRIHGLISRDPLGEWVCEVRNASYGNQMSFEMRRGVAKKILIAFKTNYRQEDQIVAGVKHFNETDIEMSKQYKAALEVIARFKRFDKKCRSYDEVLTFYVPAGSKNFSTRMTCSASGGKFALSHSNGEYTLSHPHTQKGPWVVMHPTEFPFAFQRKKRRFVVLLTEVE